MKTRDNWLMEVTKPVWVELADADCNPDIIPFSLCDACEIGFNRGFTAGLTTMGICVIGAAIGGIIYATKKK